MGRGARKSPYPLRPRRVGTQNLDRQVVNEMQEVEVESVVHPVEVRQPQLNTIVVVRI